MYEYFISLSVCWIETVMRRCMWQPTVNSILQFKPPKCWITKWFHQSKSIGNIFKEKKNSHVIVVKNECRWKMKQLPGTWYMLLHLIATPSEKSTSLQNTYQTCTLNCRVHSPLFKIGSHCIFGAHLKYNQMLATDVIL